MTNESPGVEYEAITVDPLHLLYTLVAKEEQDEKVEHEDKEDSKWRKIEGEGRRGDEERKMRKEQEMETTRGN
ncbi:hypothetical protein Pmani_019716 [Petrolisthes manimaculis]|uniref:Uncharacterized protein n=1 Tax=Petrolisthes manimaculis TaxID=1843537 RepID=A0AAE1PK72_9EUCA|nr:hypothetical protein Pmani_019716 [Petrolisthes manimaculis]